MTVSSRFAYCQLDLVPRSSILENKLSKYFFEVYIAEINNEYNSLELGFSSVI